jgi:hypothetical protein
MTGVFSMTKPSLQFVGVLVRSKDAGQTLRRKLVDKQFSTLTAMIGVQHMPLVKVR